MTEWTTEEHFARLARVIDEQTPMLERIMLLNEYGHLMPHGGFFSYEESNDDDLTQRYLVLLEDIFSLLPTLSQSPYLITPSVWYHNHQSDDFFTYFRSDLVPLHYFDVEETACELINRNAMTTLQQWVQHLQFTHFHNPDLMSCFIRGLAHADIDMSYYYDLREPRQLWLPLYASVGFPYHSSLTINDLDNYDFVYQTPTMELSEIPLSL